jgi:hypothetical protein
VVVSVVSALVVADANADHAKNAPPAKTIPRSPRLLLHPCRKALIPRLLKSSAFPLPSSRPCVKQAMKSPRRSRRNPFPSS